MDKEVGPQERLSLHNSESRRLLINFVGESSLLRVSGGGWSREGPGRFREVLGRSREASGIRRVILVDCSERKSEHRRDPGARLGRIQKILSY